MGSTKYRPRKVPLGLSLDEGFDDLREAFYARLQGERVQLVTLSAALARTEESPQRIFDDLVYRAHMLRGGAAILEIRDVADAAKALEHAAVAASRSHANHSDAGVWTALVALVSLMGAFADATPAKGSAIND